MIPRLRNMTSLYLVREDAVLCLYRIGSKVVNHRFVGAAGGHFEPEELNDPKRCVLREAWEELGLQENDMEGLALRYLTIRQMAGEIRQNYYFFARLKKDIPLQSTEGNLQWVRFDQIPELYMPVSAKHMILHYLQIGQFNEEIYGGITEETGTTFVPMRSFGG